jgi:hypothetical protein
VGGGESGERRGRGEGVGCGTGNGKVSEQVTVRDAQGGRSDADAVEKAKDEARSGILGRHAGGHDTSPISYLVSRHHGLYGQWAVGVPVRRGLVRHVFLQRLDVRGRAVADSVHLRRSGAERDAGNVSRAEH